MASNQEPKEELSFWADEDASCYPLLEAFPFNSAKNDLKYDVFTDGFPPLYEQGKCGSKRLWARTLWDAPASPGFQSMCLRTAVWLF